MQLLHVLGRKMLDSFYSDAAPSKDVIVVHVVCPENFLKI
jgi:hypothetical protein